MTEDVSVKLHFAPDSAMTRRCGDCQLCCKLVPVKSLGKTAGRRCRYQKAGKGCTVHARLETVSPSCRYWNCRWLVNDDTGAMSRPDRAHYVIDIMPDFITIRNDETGEAQHVEAVQVWLDPDYPEAERDPPLLAYLERRSHENKCGLLRWDNARGVVVFPPKLSADGQWHFVGSDLTQHEEHSLADVAKALTSAGAPFATPRS